MSTILMSTCWPLQGMSPAQKAVLISLADQANDDGYCWPSVKTISMRTCLSERAVQGAIRWLQEVRLLGSSKRSGTSTVYQLTPAAYAPPQEMHPADAAPKPSMNHQLNHQEPIPPRAKKSPGVVKPDGVTDQTWADWLQLRKSHKATVTQTAVDGIAREAAKAGYTLEAALQVCCTNGWRGFKAEWVMPRQQGALPGAGRGRSLQSFAQQDREEGMRRWEEQTGRVHPDRLQQQPQHGGNVIDVTARDAGHGQLGWQQ